VVTRYEVTTRPRSEWKLIPIPLGDEAPPRRWVDAVAERLAENGRRPPSKAAKRFSELSGGLLRCAHCGCTMGISWRRRKSGKVDFWYRCWTRYSGRVRECENNRLSAALPLEEAVWREVHALITDRRRLQAAYSREIERRRSAFRGDPQKEADALAKRLEKLDAERLGYVRQNARGVIDDDELDLLLIEVDGLREGTMRALREAQERGDGIERLRRELLAVFARFEQIRCEDLLRLPPEERRRAYLGLRVRCEIDKEKNVVIKGAFGADLAEILSAPPEGPYPVSPEEGEPAREHPGAVTLDNTSGSAAPTPPPASRAGEASSSGRMAW
jgi:hypothetical protein